MKRFIETWRALVNEYDNFNWDAISILGNPMNNPIYYSFSFIIFTCVYLKSFLTLKKVGVLC